jgi:hypothetical protein
MLIHADPDIYMKNKLYVGTGNKSLNIRLYKSLFERQITRFTIFVDFGQVAFSWIRIRIPNTDSDPGTAKMNADACGSDSLHCRGLQPECQVNWMKFLKQLNSVADPGCLSRIQLFSIPDPNCLHSGSRIRIKEFKYFNPQKTKKKVSKL